MKPIIYIVDDNLVSQFATQIVLEQSSSPCTVKCFDDGEQALDAIQASITKEEGLPKIILLDLNMPKVDGWEFLDQIKNTKNIKTKIDIFIISSFTNSQDRSRAHEHTLVEGYFEKPLSKTSIDKIFPPKSKTS